MPKNYSPVYKNVKSGKDYFVMPQKSDLIPKSKNYTPMTELPNYTKTKNSKAKSTSKLLSYDYSPYSGSQTTGGYSSGSGVKWYDVVKGDISGLLAAYDQQANTAKANAKSKLDTTRNDLLTSINRFREQNAKDQLNQKQQYQSGQASLESARAQADRQSRIGASARGLGGSGLQQLAQMQNLLGQSEDISKLANENQASMDKLRDALKQEEEDYNTNVKNAETEYSNTIRDIDATALAQRKQAEYENEQRYIDQVNARNAAVSQYSYSSSPGSTESWDYTDTVKGGLRGMQAQLRLDLTNAQSIKNDTKRQEAVNKAIQNAIVTINDLNNTYGLGNNYSTATRNINTLLQEHGFKKFFK